MEVFTFKYLDTCILRIFVFFRKNSYVTQTDICTRKIVSVEWVMGGAHHPPTTEKNGCHTNPQPIHPKFSGGIFKIFFLKFNFIHFKALSKYNLGNKFDIH
jgi:hypothetical protein